MKATGKAKVTAENIYTGYTLPIIEHYLTDGNGVRVFRLSLEGTIFEEERGYRTTVMREDELSIIELEIELTDAEKIEILQKEKAELLKYFRFIETGTNDPDLIEFDELRKHIMKSYPAWDVKN